MRNFTAGILSVIAIILLSILGYILYGALMAVILISVFKVLGITSIFGYLITFKGLMALCIFLLFISQFFKSK